MEASATQFRLDGQTVTAQPGETVLSVARRCGIEIPTLCHHDAVTPYGACRLCLVEVVWGTRSKIVTSCIYTPWEGDVILTNSERVRQARRLTLELLLARCPTVESIRSLAREYGVEASRFQTQAVDGSTRCILCGLCVRVCDEVVGQHAIGYAQRGSERVISSPYGAQTDECVGCLACVFVCPTQALHYEDVDGKRIMKEFHTEMPLVACRVCGMEFATARNVAKIQQQLNLPLEYAETCPRCRGTQFREVMEHALITRATSGSSSSE